MSTRKMPPKIFDYFVLVFQPTHPRATGGGYVPEQYIVAESVLGRRLTPDEEVRHLNGNTQDNRPSNLEVISFNADYKVWSLGTDTSIRRNSHRTSYMSCKFQKPCWKNIRAPIARKNKVYLPYLCSYQTEGDIYKCSKFWGFIDEELESNDGSEKE